MSKEIEDQLKERLEKDSSLTAGNIGEVLKFILNSVFSDGEYYGSSFSDNIGPKPILAFSPVIILRNRSIGGILEALKNMDEQLEGEIEVSDIFGQLTGKTHTGNNVKIDNTKTFNGEIFFPKPYNDEQRSIINKINCSNGVVVQGPPGTGKSHTIANLICHLLATGNRVLVTAKTTTALSVLRSLLPEQMRSLAICMLGYGDRKKNLLEESVFEILSKGDSFDKEKCEKRIEKLYEKLDSLRKSQALKERQLIDTTKSETHSQMIVDGQYSGTATEIAKKISRERERYKWFKDNIPPDERFSLSQEELYPVLHGMRKFKKLKGELSRYFEDVMPSETFCDFINCLDKISVPHSEDLQDSELYQELSMFSEKELELSLERIRFLQEFKKSILPSIELLDKNLISSAQKTFSKQSLRKLLLTQQDDLSVLEDKVTKLISQKSNIAELKQTIQLKKEQILSLSESWIDATLNEIMSLVESDEVTWAIDNILMEIEKFADVADSYKVNIPDDVSLKQITTSIERLIEYVTRGKSLNKFNIFMPKKVRNAQRIVNEVCDINVEDLSLVELENIKNSLFFETEMFKAIQLLMPYFQVDMNISRFGQLKQIKRGNSVLKKIFEIKKQLLELQVLNTSFLDELKKFMNSSCLLIYGASFVELVDAEKICSFFLLGKRKSRASNALSSLVEQLRKITMNKNAHTVMRNLLKAVEKNDTCMYGKERIKLDNLLEKRAELVSINKAIDKIRKIIPLTVKAMEETCEEHNWDIRISKIQQAWYHSQATNWILNYIGADKSSKIKIELDNIIKEIRETIGEIALEKSWNFCITNLTSEQKKHMALWQQAVRKLGKGTGKYANRHIKSAQSHFSQCRDAVPAWIMPLHNVWSNVTISPGVFDVIIIDEASQCGIEAVPLFYMAKKIIIVGDNKQISPENVGLDRSIAHKWADEYLQNIDKDLFDIDNSMFDIGEAVFNQNKVVLREHFRCMPEIIEFSNRLCYQHTPLIPLKQYGKERLVPLESIFLPDGYKEGEGANSVNMSEAKAIVDKIVQICSHEKYLDKSIGAIVLQGKRQASEIEMRLSRSLGERKIREHQIKCGTPEQFQGDERDIVLLSMVVANNTPFSALTKQSYERRFNVAMSRAKEQVILVHSVKSKDLSPYCLRRRLIDFFENKNGSIVAGVSLSELKKLAETAERKEIEPPCGFDSWFEVDVAIEIITKGYRITPQYEVAGRRIDIVVEGGKSRLAVECDGDYYHSTAEQQEYDICRQRQLERCGWDFFRIRSSVFYYDRHKSMNELWLMLEERGIYPISVQES